MTDVERDERGRIVPYCWDGCGKPATHDRLTDKLGPDGETPVIEMVCEDHAGPTGIRRGDLS